MLPSTEGVAAIDGVKARLLAGGVPVHSYSYTADAVTFYITPSAFSKPTFLDMSLVPSQIDNRKVFVQIKNEDELYVKAGA